MPFQNMASRLDKWLTPTTVVTQGLKLQLKMPMFLVASYQRTGAIVLVLKTVAGVEKGHADRKNSDGLLEI
jgi:hypothetical protein